MSYILIPVLLVLMGMVIYSLVRGIMAFLNSTKEDLNLPVSEGATPNQLLQNKMMFARIKYQALAIVVVGIIFAISK
jgi:hypothetical protein